MLLYIPMSNWLDLSNVSNTLKSSYVKGFVDVSGGDIIARNGNFLLTGDASLNSNLFVAGDLSLNQRLHVDGDVTITGNLKADKISNEYIINSETTNYTLIVAEDLSLNGKLLISEDASFNEDVYIKGNLSLDGPINNISTTELNYLDGVTSAIQTQIDTKQNKEHLTEFIVTVATKTASHPHYGSGSASGYVIDGLESPVLNFKSGNTYKFDQSNGSNIGWTLRFYLDSDKTTAYTSGLSSNGTAGSTGAYVQLIVDDNTPTKLFYRCADVNQDLMGHYIATELSSAGVSNTEFSYLDGVTSAIQTQMDTKLASNASEFSGNAATVTNGVYTTSSVAVLSDVSDAGSGAIITTAERNKLSGIATSANNYSLPTAASDTLGGIKVGSNLSIDGNGVLSASAANNYTLPTAASNTLGGIKVGSNLSIDGSGVLSSTDTNTTYLDATTSDAGLMSTSDKSKLDGIAASANNYTLPAATTLASGGIIVGSNLSITDGVLSATDTNTTYSVGDGGLTENDFTDTLKTKLDNIENSANNYVLPTADTNTLGGFKVGTNLTMNGSVLSSADTTYTVGDGGLTQKNFTTTLNTKLDNIEESADVTDATNVLAAGAVMTTGDQTIAGTKTFSSLISGSIDGNAATATTAGTVTTAAQSAITSVGNLTGLTIAGDLSLNQNLSMDGDASFNGDVHIVGNLKADKISNDFIINTETTNYTLIIAEDLSLNNRLFIEGDASFNEDVYIKGSLSIDGTVPTWNQDTTGKATTAGTADTSTKLNTTTNGIVKTSNGDGTLDIGALSSSDIPNNAADTSGKATTAGTADIATKLNTTTNGIVKTSNGDGTLAIGALSSGDIPNNAADTSGKATTAGTADIATKLNTTTK